MESSLELLYSSNYTYSVFHTLSQTHARQKSYTTSYIVINFTVFMPQNKLQ